MGGPGAAQVFAQTKRNDNATTTQRQRNYRRNFPPMVESTTIAAMLKAMAIAMVMANNAIHMA